MNKLQLIETAPKDGTPILAFDDIAQDWIVIVWSESDVDADDACWRVRWNGDENPDCKFWTVLPASPA